MCGIAGIFYRDPDARVEEARIRSMCDAIVHRGPDDDGRFVCGPVGLGMRRLSIIDLAGGHQPMRTADGAVTIVYNGEVYNYRDVRRTLESRGFRFRTASDTECILHAYEAYGPDCLKHLNGMFAIAIWDARRRQLFLARDRLGIKPLYLYQTDGELRFASEIKALLADRTVPRDLDEGACAYFFRYGYVASPRTLLRSVTKLPPAHYLVADRCGVRLHRYWSLQSDREPLRSEQEYAAAVYAGLERSVASQLVSDVPLGAFLSGGLDSSSIVHFMSEATGARVNTYSIGFRGADAFHSELEDARFVARRYETRHHEILVEPDVASLLPKLVHHLDEPLADSSFIVTYLVSTLARNTVKVILSGVGGDELFGGYRRYLGPRLARYYGAVPAPVRQALGRIAACAPVDRGSLVTNYLRLARCFLTAYERPAFDQYDQTVQLMSEGTARDLCPSLGPVDGDLSEARRAAFAGARNGDGTMSMLHLDLNTSLSESLLLLTDKMSMAASLEARVPFLDHELVELASTIPPSWRIKGTRLRYIQKRSMEGSLPARILRKRKRGFGCPVGAWFRTALRPLLMETFSRASIRRRGLFAPATIAAVIADHDRRQQDYTDLLLALLLFELWCREWLD